mmetsp:Transcript_40126/g.108380  ORF Transcript_40126/g.108380 Transcript_40126/m.108380 type:complete len:264 (-) Transcript_40126:196-987(-)
MEANAHVGIADRGDRPVLGATQRHSRAHLHVRHALKIQSIQEVKEVDAQVLQVAMEHEVREEAPELALLHARGVEREEAVQIEDRHKVLEDVPDDAERQEGGERGAAVADLVDGVREVHEGPEERQHPEHRLLAAVHAQGTAFAGRRASPALLPILRPHDPLGVSCRLALARALQGAAANLRGAVLGAVGDGDAGGGRPLLACPALRAVTSHERLLGPLVLRVPRDGAAAWLWRTDSHISGAHGGVALADLDLHRHGIAKGGR